MVSATPRATKQEIQSQEATAGAVASSEGVRWKVSHRADRVAVALADRHYNRQHIGSPQFVPPGRNLCFVTPEGDAAMPAAAVPLGAQLEMTA